MILHMISHMISCCAQDCVVLLAPYQNNPNPVESFNIKTDFDLKGDGLVWYARPQLFFNYVFGNCLTVAGRFIIDHPNINTFC